jgi:hypothetical protein
VPVWLSGLMFSLVLGVGVSLKIGAASHRPDGAVDQLSRVGSFLEQQGYRRGAIHANRGLLQASGAAGTECLISVVQARAQGWDQHSLRQMAGPGDDFFVVFEGAIYDNHPMWLVRAYSYWDRARRHVGIMPPERPVLAIIAARSCAARNLPWSKFFRM